MPGARQTTFADLLPPLHDEKSVRWEWELGGGSWNPETRTGINDSEDSDDSLDMRISSGGSASPSA